MEFGSFQGAGTIVVLPSISFPSVELRKITGVVYYEERLLFTILALRNPDLRLVYLTSVAVDPAILDYYLSFLPDPDEARSRLTMVAVGDDEPRALTSKILDRPELVQELRHTIGRGADSFILPFNVTARESALAEALDVPLFGPHPGLNPLGSKSGARRIAREAGVPILDGAEDLWSIEEMQEAVRGLKRRNPELNSIVAKLNNGFSGQGNAIIFVGSEFAGLHHAPTVFCADDESWESFGRKVAEEGAVVEEHVVKAPVVSPSAQVRIVPGHEIEVLSTHDQILGGPDNQVYLGCRFPADEDYRMLIKRHALSIAHALEPKGVIGSFGVDFIIKDGDAYLSEINLRMGGTTHPLLMTRLVTEGVYEDATGELLVGGRSKSYLGLDNIKSPRYVGLSPGDVVRRVHEEGLAFDRSTDTGVTLHLLGALREFGKFGAVCIADSHEDAAGLQKRLVEVIDALADEAGA